jgi:hypothetical protein
MHAGLADNVTVTGRPLGILRRFAYPLTILAVIISGPSHAQHRAHSEIRASYLLVKTDLTVGEPVFVRFKVENATSGRVTLDLGLNGYEDFRLWIVRPNGLMQRAPIPMWTMGTSGKVSLAPFTSYEQLLLISRWFNFDTPGVYGLDITPLGPTTTTSGAELPRLAEGHLLIDIGPRNPKRLEQICSDLEKKIIEATTAAVALELVEVLNHIVDPIAVPHLARLLHPMSLVNLEAVKGLVRIADGPAIDVLIAHLSSPSKNVRDYVRPMLVGIERKASDSTIKQKISAALQ